MKVYYPIEGSADLKTIKEAIKPFGGRCAKIVEGKLEFQIKEENQNAAYSELKEKGILK